MTAKTTLALVVGGLLPAILFGLSSVFQKTSAQAGIGTGPYLVVIGLTVMLCGAALTCIQRDVTVNAASATRAAAYGVLWASAVGCIAFALARYEARISQLVPLYNTNTLVAVVIGMIALGEWQEVRPARLLLAAVFTITGGVLAATSAR
jgi:uncharacterized membrane protein